MTKIFLTGITGLVGSAFAVALLRERQDVSIVCMTRRNTVKSALQRVEEIIRSQCEFDGCPEAADGILGRISVVDGDVVNMDVESVSKLPEMANVNVVFHCAADVNLGKDLQGKTFNINYNGTKSMLELAKLLKVEAFHYVSTAYTAGKLKGRAMEAQHPDCGHNNPYEESKWKAENLVRDSGIPFSIYRPAIITGRISDGRIRKPLAVYRIFEFLAKLKSHYCSKNNLDLQSYVDMPLHFLTSPSDRIYFAPIDFVQKAITALFQQPVCNKTYHVTGDSPVSTGMITEAVMQVLRLKGVCVDSRSVEKSADDKLMGRFLGDLFPYFSNDIIFDQTNITAVLGEDAVKWDFGMEGMETMIRAFFQDFFPDVDWVQELVKR